MRSAYSMLDVLMVAAALAAMLCAIWERRRFIRRWHLLTPGLLSTVSALAFGASIHWVGLWEPQRTGIALVALVAGGVRGRYMGLASDHAYKVVALRSAGDAIVVAGVQVLVTIAEFAIDLRNHGLSRIEWTVNLVSIVAAAYLIGRSLSLWVHAGKSGHVDLLDE